MQEHQNNPERRLITAPRPVPTRYYYAAWALGLVFSLANILWLVIDDQPHPMVDMYVEKIFNLSAGYLEKPLSDYPRLWYWSTIGPRLPMYQLLAAPIVLLLGKSVDAILLVNSVSILLLAVVTFRLATRVTSPIFALIAAALVLTFPLSVELSRLARPHAIAPLMVGLALLQCWRCLENQSVKNAWLLMLTTLLAFTTHGSSLYLLLFPVSSVIVAQLLFPHGMVKSNSLSLKTLGFQTLKSRVFVLGYLPAFSLLVVFVLSWVGLKWEQYQGLRQVLDAYFISNLGPFPLERTLPQHLNYINAALIAACMLLWIVTARKFTENFRLSICLFWLVGMFLSFHLFHKNMYWTNFSGALPLLALIAAKGLENFLSISIIKSKNILSIIIVLLVMGFALQHYLSSGWGIAKINGLPCGTLNPDCRSNIVNLRKNSPQPANWALEELLEPIVSNSQCRSEQGCSVNLVSHRSQYFSDEMLSYKLVEYFDLETRKAAPTFYPQRSVQIKRLTAKTRPSSLEFENDFIIFLTDKKGLPRQFEINHFAAAGDETQEILHIQQSLIKNNGKFELVKRLELPNEEVAHLVRVSH